MKIFILLVWTIAFLPSCDQWDSNVKNVDSNFGEIDIEQDEVPKTKLQVLRENFTDNKMLHLDKFKIKNGTEIYRGKVAPLNGHTGGGSQIFITGDNVEDILIPVLD